MRTLLLCALAGAAALAGCAPDMPSSRIVSDRGQYQRGPISEQEAETLTNQLNEARSQRSNMAANFARATNYEDRRKLQQAVFDYDQNILLLENRLRSAGRLPPR